MPRGVNRVDEARLQGMLWTPALLPTPPWSWYDFADDTTATAAGDYQELRNKGAGGPNVSQATVGSRPLRILNGLNNLNYGDFDGANDTLSNSAAFSWFTNGAMTFAAIYNPATTATSGGAFVLANGGSGASSSRKYIYTGGCDFGNTALVNSGLVANQWNIAVADVAGTGTQTQRHWANGGTPVSGSVNNGNQNNILALGSYNGAGNYTDVQIAEVVIIAAQLSDANRQRLEGYFAHKWGLPTLLPASHPYRNNPPLIGD